MYIDSHAHISASDIFEEKEQILQRAAEAGLIAIINVCTDETSLKNGLALEGGIPTVYNAAAVTPHDINSIGEEFFSLVEHHASNGNLIAIGETGLDYFYRHSSEKSQQEYLRKHLHLAQECDLPVIIHCRDAFDDLFHIIDEEYSDDSIVLHCFTGNGDDAQEALSRGWLISFSGIVTFTKSKKLRDVASHIPLNRLLIETDTPYLAPQSKRGKRNEPSYLSEIAAAIAEAKGISLDDLAQATCENSKAFFSLAE